MTHTTCTAAMLACLFALTIPGPAARVSANDDAHAGHGGGSMPAPLVARVRQATAPFRDLQAAMAAGYARFGGCVSGPQEGAMGVHYVNGGLVDGTLDVDAPEALIYEFRNGRARLVGVEYILPAPAWDPFHADVPVLEGQLLQFNGAPNRYRLPGFYELHVWAWRDNPKGTFVDWNTKVSCDEPE